MLRRYTHPIICVQHNDKVNNVVHSAEGFDLPDNLDVLPPDLHIVKDWGNAFNKTRLAEALRELGVDTGIITGFCGE